MSFKQMDELPSDKFFLDALSFLEKELYEAGLYPLTQWGFLLRKI